MTTAEKLGMVKSILRIDDTSMDALLTTYLNIAKSALLGWRYSYAAATPSDVPTEYEMTQVQAVVNGFTQSGNEGQTVSIENGIHRHFSHEDMIGYIRANVIAVAGVPGRTVVPNSEQQEDVADGAPVQDDAPQDGVNQDGETE